MPLCRLLVRFAVSLHYALNWLIVKQTTTTYDEALRAASKYYEGNETAACQWIETCALKDASGHLPEAMPEATLRRCAGALARIASLFPDLCGPAGAIRSSRRLFLTLLPSVLDQRLIHIMSCCKLMMRRFTFCGAAWHWGTIYLGFVLPNFKQNNRKGLHRTLSVRWSATLVRGRK